jgi:hypothetical protein
VASIDPFKYSGQPITLMSPEFDLGQQPILNNGAGAARFTVAISNNVMTVNTDPTGTTPHRLAVGQFVQFRNASTPASNWADWAAGWVANSFLEALPPLYEYSYDVSGENDGVTTFRPYGSGTPHYKNHGMHPGDFITVANFSGQFYDKWSGGLMVQKVLTTPNDTTFTFRHHLEQQDTTAAGADVHPLDGTPVAGQLFPIWRCVQVKSVPTPYTFTADFTHADQTATVETGATASIANLGFRWEAPDFARFHLRSAALLISNAGYAFYNGSRFASAPQFDIGAAGVKPRANSNWSNNPYHPGSCASLAYHWNPLYLYGTGDFIPRGEMFSVEATDLDNSIVSGGYMGPVMDPYDAQRWAYMQSGITPVLRAGTSHFTSGNGYAGALPAYYDQGLPPIKGRWKLVVDYMKWWKR